MKSYIQPFERELAVAELASASGARPRRTVAGDSVHEFVVDTEKTARSLAGRLAYWEWIEGRDRHITEQTLRESTVNVVRNGVALRDIAKQLPFNRDIPFPNRRCLRYGPHGIHEYRGKFFPQLVRSLLTISDVRTNSLVADPMCGSGTTLVEAALARHRAIGLDLNPLSVELTQSKCDVLAFSPAVLAACYERIRAKLLAGTALKGERSMKYFQRLPERDQLYLASWFAPQVLADLDLIMGAIESEREVRARRFLRVVLSNIIRRVSWQKVDDLRVRREIRIDADTDCIREFLDELGKSVRQVLAFLYQTGQVRAETVEVTHADARQLGVAWKRHLGKVDVVVSSPPYATALPYIDTDRLSLCFLGMLPRDRHRSVDTEMIGNREVTERGRREQWEKFQTQRRLLPTAVVSLIKRIDRLNESSEAGFRRRNLPALLAKYFFDMREVLSETLKLLRPGARAFFVVGSNHTWAGGEHVRIGTAELLMEIADSIGFLPQTCVEMDMLVSRDIFRQNASDAETILQLRKPD